MANEKNLAGQAEVLKNIGADVVSLNEVHNKTVHSEGKNHAEELARMLGMNWVFGRAIDHDGGEYGVGILSRYPIVFTQNTPVPDVPEAERERRFEPRTLLRADLDTPCGIVHVLVSHYGLSHAEQVNAVRLTAETVDRLEGPVVFMGDLNVTEDDTVLDPLDRRMESAFRGTGIMTFSSEKPEIRIDYIYTRGFTVSDFGTVDTQASDHRPVWAETE